MVSSTLTGAFLSQLKIALMVDCEKGQLEVAKHLVEKWGARVDETNQDG